MTVSRSKVRVADSDNKLPSSSSSFIRSILILPSVWGTTVSSGLAVSEKQKWTRTDSKKKKKKRTERDWDVFACSDGCVLTVHLSQFVSCVHIQSPDTLGEDIRHVGGRSGGNRKKKTGRLTEMHKHKLDVWLKQHFHLLPLGFSSSNDYIISLGSHTGREAFIFTLPQVLPSTHQTHKSTCLC